MQDTVCDQNGRKVGRLLFIGDGCIHTKAGVMYGKETNDEVVGVWC